MKAIIVEDEPLAMEELTYFIQKHSSIDIIATFEDGLDAFKYLQQQEVDAVFLDINVPSINGMLLAHNIHQFARKPYIIFTTAHRDFAAEAFEIEAFDYILKPFNEERIKGVLTKLENAAAAASAPSPAPATAPASSSTPAALPAQEAPRTPATSTKINLVKDGRIYLTDASDIYYIEAAEKQCKVFTHDAEFVMPMTLGEFIEKLPADQFFRGHRSYCINLTKIEEIIPWFNFSYMVKLVGLEQKVPVSRGNVKVFRKLMNI